MLRTTYMLPAAFAAGVLLSLQVAAAPRSPAPSGSAAEFGSLVQQIHGCHRNVELGRAGWHYHVGPACRRIAAAPRRARPYCWQECRYVGPIKTCKTRCRGDGPY